MAATYQLIDDSLAGPFGKLPLSRFLKACGTPLKGSNLPAGTHMGPMGECFRNAWHLALSGGYTYWEGYGWIPDIGSLPLFHAWCVDDVTQAVVDPTWPEAGDAVYLGIPVPIDVLTKVLSDTGTFGVLDKGRGFESQIAKTYWGWQQRPENRRDHDLGQIASWQKDGC